MNSSESLDSIREINLSYVILAQRMLLEDKSVAMFRLGLSPEIAMILANLTAAQTIKLCSSNQLLCAFRFNDHSLLSALTQPATHVDVGATHAAILLAGQPAEQFA
ncbi:MULTISPECIES: flagellar transcriptional regulator FlhD [Caballeronia]|jgi:flagellar transcriptional activator FlhD|uniref:Flagellar transcriptional regulator FlhD n=1 Tax=Caballeronia zhejiangensis TaxID=871203 RepID=A0A656QT10_9BURK|nr:MULTISPECIES: flagellar transcriptional regulator FlhD [Caballeronia]EKS71302.1 transcriptional activator FlhD [Burkholderia sp. SJ98]KDR32079.1 flagellar transcriptional regulator FlhD [Caballeronia zhejiangensis]MDR5790250.1 flagellar transcriptional regulator FlhD [Caballeronia sp. LP003]